MVSVFRGQLSLWCAVQWSFMVFILVSASLILAVSMLIIVFVAERFSIEFRVRSRRVRLHETPVNRMFCAGLPWLLWLSG